MGVQRISYVFRFSDSTITVHVFDTINVPGISSCMFNKEECPLYLYVDCTSSSSPVDRSFVDQTELSFHGRSLGGFRKLRQSSFLVVPPGCSNSQNYKIVLRRRLPPCFVSHSAYVITRHNYDDSNMSCLLLTLRVRYIMTTDP